MISEHIFYLMHALRLAQTREGLCAPNPAVGAILVKDQQVLASGYHWGKGYPHAEADAFSKAENVKGATLYVTLEPCCHTNKLTPACTELIIAKGIKAVYFGYYDPNPAVSGQGVMRLQQAGIACHKLDMPEIDQFYRPYQYWWQHHQPWITAKLALSLDGAIAGEEGKPAQITGRSLQLLTHQWRKKCDAILTTVKTVLADDPRMNIRLEEETLSKPIYILDTDLKFPLTAQLMQTAQKITLFHNSTNPEKVAQYQDREINCVRLETENGKLELLKILDHIGHEGIHHLWVEAGACFFKTLFEQQKMQQALLYIGNTTLGPSAYKSDIIVSSLLKNAKSANWQLYDDDLACHLTYE